MKLPLAKEINRAKAALDLAFCKWNQLRTARDKQAIRKNKFLLQLQRRARKLRKERIIRQVRQVKFRVNKSSQHLVVHDPSVNV